ncbi:hypothetical protein [Acidovorax sp.]|uniref:hypothetical protein n=1 Tax=Acidovorax sp. TaxID=1872122 RepID=UPI003CFD2EEB
MSGQPWSAERLVRALSRTPGTRPTKNSKRSKITWDSNPRWRYLGVSQRSPPYGAPRLGTLENTVSGPGLGSALELPVLRHQLDDVQGQQHGGLSLQRLSVAAATKIAPASNASLNLWADGTSPRVDPQEHFRSVEPSKGVTVRHAKQLKNSLPVAGETGVLMLTSPPGNDLNCAKAGIGRY